MHLQNTESSFYICEFSPQRRERINILRIAYVALMCYYKAFFLFLGTCTYKARRPRRFFFAAMAACAAAIPDPRPIRERREVKR